MLYNERNCFFFCAAERFLNYGTETPACAKDKYRVFFSVVWQIISICWSFCPTPKTTPTLCDNFAWSGKHNQEVLAGRKRYRRDLYNDFRWSFKVEKTHNFSLLRSEIKVVQTLFKMVRVSGLGRGRTISQIPSPLAKLTKNVTIKRRGASVGNLLRFGKRVS